MKTPNTSKMTLNERKQQAIIDLFDEADLVFAIIRAELEKHGSLKELRYMLMIDVFLNELKDALYNNDEDTEEKYDI